MDRYTWSEVGGSGGDEAREKGGRTDNLEIRRRTGRRRNTTKQGVAQPALKENVHELLLPDAVEIQAGERVSKLRRKVLEMHSGIVRLRQKMKPMSGGVFDEMGKG